MNPASSLKSQFLLRDDITFLNFGSFGACPKPVFEAYQNFQRELEAEPVLFMTESSNRYLKASREALATYLNCDEQDLVFVTNPSYAVNIIGKSLNLKPGDEVLATNLEYGACDKAWCYYCRQKGAKYVQQAIRFPLESKEDFISQFVAGITSKTKLVFISHLTSSTGLRLPVEDICAIAKEKGILTFIDGAHGPGQVPVNLTGSGVDIYTGACHKWMMAPKGCSFLYVRPEWQHLFDPLVISWGYDSEHPSASQFQDYHQMQGTRDIAAFLTIPAAIKFMKGNNWQAVSRACKKMVQDNAPRFCELLKATAIAPANDDFIAQLYSIPVHTNEPEALHQLLYEKYKIQVPVMQHEGNCYLRYSIQGFNTQDDLDKLYDALKAIGV